MLVLHGKTFASRRSNEENLQVSMHLRSIQRKVISDSISERRCLLHLFFKERAPAVMALIITIDVVCRRYLSVWSARFEQLISINGHLALGKMTGPAPVKMPDSIGLGWTNSSSAIFKCRRNK